MTILRNTFRAAAAALLFLGVGLSACEKSSDAVSTPPALGDSGADTGGSTVPALPALGGPMFSPDLVYRIGELDLFAVAEGKVALARSQNASVKAFANSAIEARSKAMNALVAVIEASNQTISVPDTMPNDLNAKAVALQSVSASDFDKSYLADQVNALQAAVNAMKTYSRHGDLAQFRNYASANLAGLESSLAAAQTLQSSLK